ncbi:MAG: carbohydrate-binding domain-containing protein [Bacteroidota bacterium]
MLKKIVKGCTLGLIALIIGIALFGKEELFHFLAPTEKIAAPVLVIEGWLSEEALRQAAEEIEQSNYQQVLVTSIAHDSTFRMYSQGGLRFYLSDVEAARTHQFSEIQIGAFGRAAGGIQAHAKVFLDSLQVGEFTATDKLRWYTISLSQPVQADSITITYDNNRRVGKEDRDLFVYAIRLGSLEIPARHPAVRYDRGKLDGNNVFRTDYESIAAEATEFLVQQGVDSTIVQTLTAPAVSYERTYASALMVKKHLPDSTNSVVVFSKSAHARRSWLVYQRMFGKSVNIGIIAARSRDADPQNWWKESGSREYFVLQLAKYLYTKLLFFPSSNDTIQ